MPIAKTNGAGTNDTVEAVTKLQENTSRYNGRDFEAEARGKVRFGAFNAALASPGLAGLGYTNYDEYMALVQKAADAAVAYTWQK